MLEFGEILTLAMALVAAAYVAYGWRRIRALPTLRPFVLPLFLAILSWVCETSKNVLRADSLTALSLTLNDGAGPENAPTLLMAALNMAEHVLVLATAIALLLAARALARHYRERPR